MTTILRHYQIDRHSSFGRQLQLLGWRNMLMPDRQWHCVKFNDAGRIIARQSDPCFRRDFELAQQQSGEAGL